MKLPILLLVWKRPSHTKILIDSLKEIKPNNLYIACDGPNLNNKEEIQFVNETRHVLDREITWPCKQYKFYSSVNQGCRLGVSNAINWFFDNVKEGIILEDDCIAHPDFFTFAETLIDKFRDDKRIWTISGNNYQNGIWRGDGSYYFSRYPHCWGWATWKDRWMYYADEEFIWQRLKNSKMIKNLFLNKRELHYWYSIFEMLYKKNKPDSWAYRWFLVCQAYGGLNVLPNENLVNNIGFDSSATHTKKGDSPIRLKFKNNESTGIFPLKDPSFVIRSFDADHYTFINHFKPKIHTRLLKKIKLLFKKLKRSI